jgi:hypothetical protein
MTVEGVWGGIYFAVPALSRDLGGNILLFGEHLERVEA